MRRESLAVAVVTSVTEAIRRCKECSRIAPANPRWLGVWRLEPFQPTYATHREDACKLWKHCVT